MVTTSQGSAVTLDW